MRALVFAGGSPPGLGSSDLPAADLVIAADSGLHHALDMGIAVDLVVGDLDSADPLRVESAVNAGAEVISYPADKDETDLELALGLAVARGASQMIVVGALGGRLDHLLANMALLASGRWADQTIELLDSEAHMWIVRGTRQLTVAAGATVTLLAAAGPATVTTSGFQWDLTDHLLVPGGSLGVSNVARGAGPTVTAASGVIIAIAPV